MDIFISGPKDGITMVEGCGMEFPEDRLLNILDEALKLFTPVINLILDMKSKIEKKEFIRKDSHLCSTQLSEEIENHSSILNLKSKLFTQSSKQEREKRRFWGGLACIYIYIYIYILIDPMFFSQWEAIPFRVSSRSAFWASSAPFLGDHGHESWA